MYVIPRSRSGAISAAEYPVSKLRSDHSAQKQKPVVPFDDARAVLRTVLVVDEFGAAVRTT